MKRAKYEVWIGWKNYLGEVYEKEPVAIFFSKFRAEKYLEEQNAILKNQKMDETTVYGIDEK